MRSSCETVCPPVAKVLRRGHVSRKEIPLDPAWISELAGRGARVWPEREEDDGWLWDEVAPLLSRLPSELALPLILRYVEGRPVREVARVLRLDRSVVSRRLRRGIIRLRWEVRRAGISAYDKP